MNKKLIIFILLVLVAIGGVVGFWYWRKTFSASPLATVQMTGPDTAVIGDEIEYTVHYKNTGNFVLEDGKINFELPDNSLTEDNNLRFEKKLGTLNPGEGGSVIFKGRLFGAENDVKEAHTQFFYTPHNLSVRYESDASAKTRISLVPITLACILPNQGEKGKEITYTISYASDVDYPLENLSLKMSPTPGLTIKSSQPSSLDNSEWKLKPLLKGQGGSINITGLIAADAPDQLNVSANLGMWQNGTFIVIKHIDQDLKTVQPPQPVQPVDQGLPLPIL